MNDLMRYAASLEGVSVDALPPVHLWNPEFCGDINLVIKRDGTWFYEGTPIGRARLVRLFSTVLKKEGEKYFLVTPVEKLGIEVEDSPFVAVLMQSEGEGDSRQLTFTTNVGDQAKAGPQQPISFRNHAETCEDTPYIEIRDGLEARIARAVYYDLVELGETHEIDGENMFGVWSGGVFFPFSRADEVYNQT